MNKRGFLRTLEAVIAIIMILGLILYVTPTAQLKVETIPAVVEQSQSLILTEVAINDQYRECILDNKDRSCINMDYPCAGIESFIRSVKPIGYEFNCEICSTSIACVDNLKVPVDKTVYTRDTFVAGSPSKIFRVYMWQT